MRSRAVVHRSSLVLLALVVSSGCAPMNVTRSPGVTGIVVDAASGAPLAGAEVLVSKAVASGAHDRANAPTESGAEAAAPTLAEALAAARRPVVTTGADGRFSIPPEKRWIMVSLGAERAAPSGTVVVRRAGYDTVLRPVSGRTSDVGSIELTPAP